MTDREERRELVTALLRTLLAWTPAPRGAPELAAVERGFAHANRVVSCPDCLANDRVMFGCETCGGRGYLDDPGPDPYEQPSKLFGGIGADRGREAQRRLEGALRRLEQDARIRAGVEAQPDALTLAIQRRDHQYRHGSYAELERALARLRNVSETGYRLVWQFVVYGGVVHLRVSAGVERTIQLAIDLLALWMPEVIRVPDEHLPEVVARARRDSLAFGRSRGHGEQREERDARIRHQAALGWSVGKIAHRNALSKRRVYEIIGGETVATGGTAA